MKAKTIALGLAADRIDMLVCQGDRIIAHQRLSLTFDSDPARWGKAVKESAKAVGAAAKEMNAAGAPVFVLYRSPTECAEYTNVQFRSGSQARQAAILTCTESLSYPLDLAVCQAVVVGRDAAGEQRQTHVMVAADRDDAVSQIATMIEEAGLKFISATPLEAAIMSKVVSQGLAAADGYAGYLYVGEHRSFFVIAGEGSLLFARPISLGIEALISCLTKPIRSSSGGEPIQLNRIMAKEILHKHGFPDRKQIVHEGLNLTGGQIIPLLQPLLQRYVLELRQSLRFGLNEERRQSVRIVISGPGSAIPNFASIIAEEIGLSVTVDEEYKSYDCHKPDSSGSPLVDAVKERKALTRLGLQPRHVSRLRHVGRLRRSLWTGAAAALVLIGVDAVRCRLRINNAREQAGASASRNADMKVMQTQGEKLFAAIGAVNKLEAAIAAETASQVNLRACLHELSSRTPPSVRLTNISFHKNDGRMIGTINGFVFDGPDSGDQTQLERFIDQLRGSPLFEKVMLANVQVGVAGELTGQRFETHFTAIAAPRQPQPGIVAAAKPETGP